MIEKLQPMRWTCKGCGRVLCTLDNTLPDGWFLIEGNDAQKELLFDVECDECTKEVRK